MANKKEQIGNGSEHSNHSGHGDHRSGPGGNGSDARLRRTLSRFIVPYCSVVAAWTFAADFLGHPIGAETRNIMLGILSALLGLFAWQQWKGR